MFIRPKTLGALKYGGALVTLLCLGVWIASGRMYAGYIGTDVGLAAFAGQIEYSRETAGGGMPFNYAGREGWNTAISRHWEWRNEFEHFSPLTGLGTREVYYVPIWWFCAASFVPTVVLWWRYRTVVRHAAALCTKCDYNLEGLALDAPCPECGSKRHIT